MLNPEIGSTKGQYPEVTNDLYSNESMCALLVADFILLFCNERNSMASLFYHKQADIIEAFNSK